MAGICFTNMLMYKCKNMARILLLELALEVAIEVELAKLVDVIGIAVCIILMSILMLHSVVFFLLLVHSPQSMPPGGMKVIVGVGEEFVSHE